VGDFYDKMHFLVFLGAFSNELREAIRCVLKLSGKDFSNALLMES
jgi:hypothetical protein